MNTIKSLPTEHPSTFGLLVTFIFVLMLIVSAILGNLWPGEDAYGQPGGIIGRSIFVIMLLALLSRLGWLRSAGLTSLGGWRTWLILPLPLAYSIVGSAYALTRSLEFKVSNPAQFGLVVLFILIGAFMEEVVFRGLVLHLFVRAWDSTNRGILKSILVSALFFSSIHLLDYLAGRPLTAVLLQTLQATFLGIFLAVLVLSSRSIYPAAVFHGILNLAAYLNFASQGLEPAPAAWLSLSLVMLLLAVISVYLFRSASERVQSASAGFKEELLKQ